MTKPKLPREESNGNGWRAIAAELTEGSLERGAACSLCHKGHVQMSAARPHAGPRPVHKGSWEPSHAPLTVGVSMHMWQEAGLRLMGSHSRGPVWNRLGMVVLDSAGEHPTLRGAHLPIIRLFGHCKQQPGLCPWSTVYEELTFPWQQSDWVLPRNDPDSKQPEQQHKPQLLQCWADYNMLIKII